MADKDTSPPATSRVVLPIPVDLSTRRSFSTEELPPEIVEAIANSRMDPKFDYLNDLLED